MVMMWVVCICTYRQRGLFEVLKAYTQYKPNEGYCQAQGPVAAVLLMNMPTEVQLIIIKKTKLFEHVLLGVK